MLDVRTDRSCFGTEDRRRVPAQTAEDWAIGTPQLTTCKQIHITRVTIDAPTHRRRAGFSSSLDPPLPLSIASNAFLVIVSVGASTVASWSDSSAWLVACALPLQHRATLLGSYSDESSIFVYMHICVLLNCCDLSLASCIFAAAHHSPALSFYLPTFLPSAL